MASDRLPLELDCGNLAREWPTWKRNFIMYMIANNKMNDPEPQKIATFLWLVGSRAAEIYNTLFPNDGTENSIFGIIENNNVNNEAAAIINNNINEAAAIINNNVNEAPAIINNNINEAPEIEEVENAEARSLNIVLKAFDEYCLPQKNIAMETFKFNTIIQKEKQLFAEFETELRTQLRYCEFKCTCGELYENRMLRDRIILGIHDKKLQLKLLDGRDEPLKRVINTCKVYEAANANKNILDRRAPMMVNAIKNEQQTEANAIQFINRACFNCGSAFNRGHIEICKAKDIICKSCMKKGHFQKYCRSRGKIQQSTIKSDDQQKTKWVNKGRNISNIDWNIDNSGTVIHNSYRNTLGLENNNKFYRINTNINGSNIKWMKKYRMNGVVVEFKIDTGADVNCIPIIYMKKMNLKIKKNNKFDNFPVFDYNKNKIKIFGSMDLMCCNLDNNSEQSAEFLIVENNHEPILGLETCIKFGLIKRLDINSLTKLPTSEKEFINEFNDLFDGLGKFPGKSMIQLKENSVPALHYKKRIPFSLTEKLKLKLEKMVKDGIISSVDYPTDWVNNLQIVEKPDGDLRICLDPKPLNACIKREHYLIPTMDDVISKLANKKLFTVLDLSNGFWHMELDKKSSDLTTFMTPFGRFKFNRVPFGINSAPEMFQRKMIQTFGDIPGIIIYFDDISITAENEKEHDELLSLVIKRARQNNIKFNSKKMQYKKEEIKFMGHMISEGKIKSDNKHIEALLKMKKPKNKKDVMRLLGLLKFLAKFIPQLSKLTAELRNLTRNDVEWNWNEKHDSEIKKIVDIVTSSPVLAIFDPQQQIIVQTDASKDGLGCVLLQNDHPIAYASRTLTKTEQKYAQIEKELLAIVFACQRFHIYLYGREFVVQSDHKPLETLIKRNIDDVTSRLQRMFMSLLKYPKIEIVYTPGRNMLVADFLSRAQLTDTEELSDLSGIIHSISRKVCISKANYDNYREIIRKDKIYWKICEYVINGWPKYHHLDDLSKKFHRYKSELHFENGLLFKNHKLVIPSKIQTRTCKGLHEPHMGIEKTLARARMYYFWPNMSKQISEMIASCSVCEKFKRNNQKEPLKQEITPKYPFQSISMDLLEYAGRVYIAIIDAYSGFVISEQLSGKTTREIIMVITKIFNRIGYPSIIKCDNSPFGSREFEQFTSDSNIQLKFSSPRYPQSNGLAEKGVAIAKNLLKRCYEVDEVDKYQYRILEYNTTPVSNMQVTPSDLFFGRLVKTKLPISEYLLMRNSLDEQIVQERIEKKKEKQKYYYDRLARKLTTLKTGDLVIFKKNGKDWNYGTIVGNVNDRSYIIRDNFDNYFRRNRRFIAKTHNNELNPSEILYEEHITKHVPSNNLDQYKEIQIVKPSNGNQVGINIGNNGDENIEIDIENNEENGNKISYEAEQINTETLGLSEFFELMEDDPGSENVVEPNASPTPCRTRSGRISAPPQRYGDWTI